MVTRFKKMKQRSFCKKICIPQERIEKLLSIISPTRYLETKTENEIYDKSRISRLLIRRGIIPGNISLEEKRDAWIYRYKRQLREHNNYTNH